MQPRTPRRFGAVQRLVGHAHASTPSDTVASLSMEERMALVWQLTVSCLAWNGDDAGEPRLQRSICRVERRRR
jgi:hypothetical protein